jgi:hypothetical protein
MLEDEATSSLTDTAWRLFGSLILLADDYGNLRGSPSWISGQVFWAASKTVDVEHYLSELVRKKLIVRYVVRDQAYIAIRSWNKHQRIDKPGKPRVPGQEEASQDFPANDSRESREEILAPRQRLATDMEVDLDLDPEGEEDHDHDPEGEGPTPLAEARSLAVRPPDKPDPQADQIREVFAHYREHHPRAHRNPLAKSKEWRAIKTRLAEGSTVEELKLAIDGMHKSPFHQGENDGNKIYDSLELAMRSGSQVAKFIEIAERSQAGPAPVLSEREMRGHRANDAFLALTDPGRKREPVTAEVIP